MAYSVSDTVKMLFMSERPQIFRGEFYKHQPDEVITDLTIYVDEGEILSGTLVLDRSCTSGNSLELGACIASEISMTILNENNWIGSFPFEGSELTAQIGVVDDNNVNQLIPLGKFIVEGVPKVRDTVTIRALDRMILFDKYIGNDISWWTSATTVGDIISRCCSVCGVALATNISSFPNVTYPAKQIEQPWTHTWRELLSYACALMGKCAWMNAEGNLEIGFAPVLGTITPTDPRISAVFTTGNRYSSDYEDFNIVITGLTYSRTEKDQNDEDYEHQYVVGTTKYAFDLSDNPLVDSSIQQLLSNLNGLIGIAYTPLTLTTVPVPWLFPMDWVRFTKLNGNNTYAIVTNYTFMMNGNNGVRSVGESPTNKQLSSVGSVSKLVQELIDYTNIVADETLATASDQATQLITSATGGQVYFKKDANGVIQEIDIMDDVCYADFISPNPTYTVGKCWRWNKNGFGYSDTGYNGTYNLAMTMNGQIVADFIATGILKDNLTGGNSWNLNTGQMNITKGSLQITTANDTDDIIELNYTDRKTAVSSKDFTVESTNSDETSYYGNTPLETRIGGGVVDIDMPSPAQDIHKYGLLVRAGDRITNPASVDVDLYPHYALVTPDEIYIKNGRTTDEAYGSYYAGTQIRSSGIATPAIMLDGDLINDCVIASGTSGNWYYRKWKNGRYECWLRQTTRQAVNTAWRNLYYAEIGAVAYPISFIEYPVLQITGQSETGSAWIAPNYSDYSVSSTGTVYVYTPASSSSMGVTLNYYANGRWK